MTTTEETTTTNEPPDHNPKSHPETTGTAVAIAVPPIPTNHDLVIRDGFPALFCVPSSQETTNELASSSSSSPPKPNIDDIEHIPLTPFWSTRDDTPLLFVVSSSTSMPSSSSLSSNTKHDSQQQQQEWWEQIQHDCQVVFDARTRSGNNDDDDDDDDDDDEENHNIETEYSEGSTYFLPCSMKPRCTLEQMVHSIFQLHTQHLHPSTFVPEQSGAEWWTLVLNAHDDNHDDTNKDHDEEDDDDDDDDEVGLHFDADYGLEHQVRNMMIHPRVATVTYMSGNCHSPNIQNNVHHHNTTSTIMAPTTIYNMHSPHSVRNIDDRDPKRALTSSVQPIHTVYISYPQWGKHIAFDGRLLHGAPSTTSVLTKALTQQYQKKQQQATKHQNHSEERPNKKYKSDPSSTGTTTTTTTTTSTAKSPVRITLMVNIWLNHCPMDAEPLEDEILDHLITPFDDASKYKNDDDTENTTVSKKPSPPYWNDAVVPYATALAAHNADMTHDLQTKKSKTHKDDDNALIPVTKIDITASSKNVAASTEEMILCHHNVTVTYDTALVEALEEYTTTTAMNNNSNVQLNIEDVNLIQFKVNDEIPDSDEDYDTNDN